MNSKLRRRCVSYMKTKPTSQVTMLPRCGFIFRYILLTLISVAAILVFLQMNISSHVINRTRIHKMADENVRIPNPTTVSTTTISPSTDEATSESRRLLKNHHPFKYIHNPTTMCESKNVFMLIYVHTSPTNLKKRTNIRETWGGREFLITKQSRIVFFMGKVENPIVMDAVTMEFNHYGDIVQEDYADSYRNLSHKANGALKWVSKYCDSAKYILKTDDDILVDIFRLIDYIHTKLEVNSRPAKDILLCNVWHRMGVLRNKESKWYISKEEFPYDVFPVYCSGSAFLMSGDVVHRMEISSRTTPFFWVDDYYLTGMVFKNLQINHKPFNEAYNLNQNIAIEKFRNDTKGVLVYFHIGKVSIFYDLWRLMKETNNKKVKKLEHVKGAVV